MSDPAHVCASRDSMDFDMWIAKDQDPKLTSRNLGHFFGFAGAEVFSALVTIAMSASESVSRS